MQTRPRTGALITPTGIIEPGKLYSTAELTALGVQPKGTRVALTSGGEAISDGTQWNRLEIESGSLLLNGQLITGEAGLPLESNASIAFTEGVDSITAEVVPGQFGTLAGNNVWEGSVAFGGLAASTVTTKQNNYTPTDLENSRNLRWTGAGSTGFTGFLAQVDGFEFILENHTSLTTGYLLWLEHESASSTANNRIQLPKAAPAFLFPGDSIMLRYNLSAQRWRVISWISQGKMMGLTEFNDFITEPASGFVSGTGASIANASASNWSSLRGHGAATISTGTATTGRAGLGVVGTNLAANVIPGHGPMLFLSSSIVSTAPDGTETYVAASGFSDIQDGTIDNGAFWELWSNAGVAEWSQTVVSAGTPTRRTTNSPVVSTAATVQLGTFYSGDGLRADFIHSVDGKTFTLSGSVTTGLPAVNGSGIMSVCLGLLKSAGTTARTMLVDYIGFRVDSLRA